MCVVCRCLSSVVYCLLFLDGSCWLMLGVWGALFVDSCVSSAVCRLSCVGFAARCASFVVRCLLSVVRCVLFAAYCFVCVVRCVMFVGRCLLCVACCSLTVCSFLFVWWLLVAV